MFERGRQRERETERKRDREGTSMGGAEGEGEADSSLSREPDLGGWGFVWDPDLSENQTLNRLIHPGSLCISF